MDLDKNENEILICCALRFDGWAYCSATGFDQRKAIDDFFETGRWELTDQEKLAVFFLLQRGLYKWDLVYEPKHGRFWRAFRTLFFEVCELDAGEPYRGMTYIEEWERDYKPILPQCIEVVRRVHESTQYDDNAPPNV